MSNEAWHGGKGSASRVSNMTAYRNSPIWDKPNNLFLDDIREPHQAYLYSEHEKLVSKSKIPNSDWNIVRDYESFCAYIDRWGVPDVVSFDNDLWDVTATDASPDDLAEQFLMIGWQDFKIKTGAHCAQYLVEYCVKNNVQIPTYYIHTANSAARPIIEEILENGKDQIQKQSDHSTR